MSQKGASVYSLLNQLGNRLVVSDGVKALIVNGVAVGEEDMAALNTVYRFTRPKNAENIGINAAYDANNNVYLYQGIVEFFRLFPEGVLYVLIVEAGVTQREMIEVHRPLLMKSPVVKKNERISSTALRRNTMNIIAETSWVNGLWEEVDEALKAWKPANALLESQGIFTGTLILDGSYLGDITTLGNIQELYDAPGCAVWVGMDNYVLLLSDYLANSADTLALLAMIGNRKACESPAALQVTNPPQKFFGQETLSMTDTLTGRWVLPRLSNGLIPSLMDDEDIEALNATKVCYCDGYHGYEGAYVINGSTAAPFDSDVTDIERWEIIQKAKHLAYQFFTPLKNKEVEIIDGKIEIGLHSWLENEATNRILGQLRAEGNISPYKGVEGAGVFLPRDYNYMTGEHDTDPDESVDPETLVVRIAIPIKGKLRNIVIYVGLKG